MVNESASYRLVYFQPDPEDGERVCIGLLLTIRDEVELLFDKEFPKLACLAPQVDLDLVATYLEDMQTTIKRSPSEVEISIRRQSPYLVTSEARRIAWPLDAEARRYLMKRFLGKHGGHILSPMAAKQETDQLRSHLKDLVQRAVRNEPIDLHENASSQWILGRKLPQVSKVALALRRTNEIVLIDGIDLTILTPGRALSRVNRVAHTFWRYKSVRDSNLDGRGLRLIGVVLNGNDAPQPAYQDAHDFALHQFDNEADLAVDASSSPGFQRLADALRYTK
jgi:hypothetical protein